jgi:predicted metalloprotease with PDZ domain
MKLAFSSCNLLICLLIISGCSTPPVVTPRQQPTQQPQEPPRFVPQPPAQQIIPPKTTSNALSAPAVKQQSKPSLGLFVDNHKTLNGALVVRFDVFKGVSPAEQAGVRKGDIIIWIASCEVTNVSTYFACIEKFKPNQRVQIAVNRDDVFEKIWVQFGERY